MAKCNPSSATCKPRKPHPDFLSEDPSRTATELRAPGFSGFLPCTPLRPERCRTDILHDSGNEFVVLRGKVVKFNPQIMGKNWLHVRDGSGDANARTNDLTITTDVPAKVTVQ
jgi:hypothetical protein